MTSDEVKWLKQVKKYQNRFQIRMTSDNVCVIDVVEDEWKFNFENSGLEFTLQILNECGYKSERV